MKMLVNGKSLSFHLLRYAGLGPAYQTHLVFFQVLGDAQAIRGLKYILDKRQSTHFTLYTTDYYGTMAALARGTWQVEVVPKNVQGIPLTLLTASLPFGAWGYNDDRYFFVTPGKPNPSKHDALFRQWAERFTPYPIPPSLSLRHVLADSRWRDGDNDDAVPVLTTAGKGLGDTFNPWVVAIKPKAFEEILEEVSYAA